MIRDNLHSRGYHERCTVQGQKFQTIIRDMTAYSPVYEGHNRSERVGRAGDVGTLI